MVNIKAIKNNIRKDQKLYNAIRKFIGIFYITNNIRYLLATKNKKNVYYDGLLKTKAGRVINTNFGDDLNQYLFEYISKKKFIFINFSYLIKTFEHYIMIGSNLDHCDLNNTIIYGSGIMNPNNKIIGNPNKIISVRGPKTREVLIKNGINCKENYGDPALLLPVFYQKVVEKKYKYGIIFNNGTNLKTVGDLYRDLLLRDDIKIIDVVNYNNWIDVIDEILECKSIISESLHGLIVAESYGIPNVWVEFIEHPDYWDFKYYDYYYSINKKDEKILHFKSIDDLNFINKKIIEWKRGEIDYDNLLSFYPFEVVTDV